MMKVGIRTVLAGLSPTALCAVLLGAPFSAGTGPSSPAGSFQAWGDPWTSASLGASWSVESSGCPSLCRSARSGPLLPALLSASLTSWLFFILDCSYLLSWDSSCFPGRKPGWAQECCLTQSCPPWWLPLVPGCLFLGSELFWGGGAERKRLQKADFWVRVYRRKSVIK